MVTTRGHVKGGVTLGGSADVSFVHGGGQVDSDIVVEVDWDNDGDFDEPVEDITGFVMAAETLTGRDWPSNLTGKAQPGKLKLTLDNRDNRFNFFNAASPLNAPPFSLETGRMVRIRTATAANPDPMPLAKDRFLGSGPLGTDELGNVWTDQSVQGRFNRQGDSSGDTLAVPIEKGLRHIATVDVGVSSFYAQAKFKFLDGEFDVGQNKAGIVYRFQDVDNYGLVQIVNGHLQLITRVAGVETITEEVEIERRRDVTFGVAPVGAFGVSVVFLEGVRMFTDTIHADAENRVGILSDWIEQRPPSFHEFHVWATLPGAVEGILWTGDVSSIMPSTAPGNRKVATLEGQGWLSKLAEQEITPPSSVGVLTGGAFVNSSVGVTSGLMVGNVLSSAGLLHPPGVIDPGTFVLGAVGLPKGKALDLARQFEEAELGFLRESQEGPIDFDDRAARLTATPQAVFSDDPADGFGYDSLEPFDWRREIVNRVITGLSPKTPRVHNAFLAVGNSPAGVDRDVTFPIVTVGNGAEEGDLLICLIASTVGTSGVEWLIPFGWKSYRDAKDFVGKQRIYAKKLLADDLGEPVFFYLDPTQGGAFVAYSILVKDWYGDLDQGVTVTEHNGFGQPNSEARAQTGENDPPPLFPSWGPAPSLFIVTRAGMTSVSGATVAAANDDNFPNGYGKTFSRFENGSVNGFDVAQQMAFREDCVEVEDPSRFAFGAGGGVFEGFEFVETTTIAVRGFAGDPPETRGGQLVQVDDFASQESHNSIRTHTNAAQLFGSVVDAEAYGLAVVDRFANDRPIFRLSFTATIDGAYRGQAIRRRVGDKIRLIANNDTGMGVDGEFFIESIAHRWTDGAKLWTVTWELSPA
jgi:hypothetical protein